MSFSLSGYSEGYKGNEQQPATPNFQSWDERVFSPYEKNLFGERVFKPSESVEDIVKEWNERLYQADNKVEKNWLPKNPNFESFKWKYWKECYESYSKYKNTTNLVDNDCWLNGMNDVFKNHPELKPIEQELTMCMMQELLLKDYDELKSQAHNEGHMIELMGWVDYNNMA